MICLENDGFIVYPYGVLGESQLIESEFFRHARRVQHPKITAIQFSIQTRNDLLSIRGDGELSVITGFAEFSEDISLTIRPRELNPSKTQFGAVDEKASV
jgi:hypothetical protein